MRPNHDKPTSIKTFIYATNGIKTAISEQFNFKVHAFFAILAISLSYTLKVSLWEFMIITIMIFLVFVSEMFNSAIEYLSDAVTTDHNPYIKKAKDVSAGAVLVMATLSVIIGAIIFIPKIMEYIA